MSESVNTLKIEMFGVIDLERCEGLKGDLFSDMGIAVPGGDMTRSCRSIGVWLV
jgi:hypothetical protein